MGQRLRHLLAAGPLQMVLLAAFALAVAAAPPLPPVPQPPIPPVNNPTVPPLGPQPGLAAAPCGFRPLGATEVRRIFSTSSAGSGVDGSTFGIDPAQPCHVFRTQPGGIWRSDGGGQFNQVYVDNSTQSPFNRGQSLLSPIHATGGGPLYFYDENGNNGVFFSPDNGQGYDQRNAGLYTGTGPTGGVGAFAVAPSNANVLYLGASFGGQWLVYSSPNGGQSWQLAGQPGAQLTSLSVDPVDPAHVVAAGGGPTTAQGNLGNDTFFESHDAGRTWATQPGPPGEQSPVEMLVGGGGLLYAKTGTAAGTLPGISNQRFWRRSTGGQWLPIVIPKGLGLDTQLVYNVANPSEMLIAAPAGGGGVAFATTFDGFASTRYSNVLSTPNSVQAIEVRADRLGDYFVQAKGGGQDYVFAFRGTALSPAVNGTPPPNNYQNAVKECPLDPLPGGGYLSGSIAYDGRFLDYTQDQLEPGVIHRLDPATCADQPPIKLTASDFGGKPLGLFSLTFDPRYMFNNGHVGAILARGGTGAQHDPRVKDPDWAAIYAVDPAGGPAEIAATELCLNDYGDDTCDLHDPNLLNYDHYLDALWAPVPDNSQYPQPVRGLARLPARKGDRLVPVPTCMSSYTTPSGDDMSMWEPGADGILYVSLDKTGDDTVLRVSSRTCQTLDYFTHQQYSEGSGPRGDTSNEDDQMACDAVTFGDGAPNVPPGTGTSVLWIRDNAKNLARAYPIVKGFCPFPTDMHLDNPPTSAMAGETKTVCAVLAANSAGSRNPIARQTITFSLAGKPLGTATTDASGRACVTFAAPPGSGSLSIVATFAGTEAYLPATASSVLRVGEPPPPAQPPPLRPAAPVHAPPPQPAVVPAPPPLAQAPQPQAQAQGQPQAQFQGQPGAMSQRQKQARVALQRLSGERHVVDLEASAYHAALLAQGAGLLMFGLGLAWRRRRDRQLRPRLRKLF